MDDTGPSLDISMSEIDQQNQCGLFRLPRELRDMIYHHVFGTGLVERHIDLHEAQALAPACFLTLTCRRIHDEASPVHQATVMTYWANNIFEYTCTDVYDQPALTTKEITHMTCIMRHQSLDDFSYETRELRSDTSHYYWDLEILRRNLEPTIDGPTTYRITTQYRNGGAWRSVRVFISETGQWYRTWR
jgi:hypothetical protein